jgi:Uma2 family endonuclease
VVIATVNVRLKLMDRGVSGEPTIRRFTGDEAIRMVEAGIVGEDEHYELLDGKLVDSDSATGGELIRRFTGDEAIRLVETGIVGEDEHVELLDGALVEMSPQGPEHSAGISNLADRLRGIYAGRAHVREEKPLTTGTFSLPEPDAAVVRGQAGAYAHKHPTGADAVLVVEVAWSSQREDRFKATTYAAGGVPVYWLVDLVARKLEVRTTPVEGAYQVTRILEEADFVELPESSERWLIRDLLL